MNNENAFAGGTERAAVENKQNARPEERRSPIAKCSPLLKSETPLSVLHTPAVSPPLTLLHCKREQQQQPYSTSGSGLVNANSADYGSPFTVAAERLPGQSSATGSSSVTSQAAFDDANKSGGGASSPNPGGRNIVVTGTPESVSMQPRPIDTDHFNPTALAELGDGVSYFPSNPQHLAGSVPPAPVPPPYTRSRSLQAFLDICDQRDQESQQAADEIILYVEQHCYGFIINNGSGDDSGQANDTEESFDNVVYTEETL